VWGVWQAHPRWTFSETAGRVRVFPPRGCEGPMHLCLRLWSLAMSVDAVSPMSLSGCPRAVFHRRRSHCFVRVFCEGPRGAEAGREARGRRGGCKTALAQIRRDQNQNRCTGDLTKKSTVTWCAGDWGRSAKCRGFARAAPWMQVVVLTVLQ
jgi:hypothetical protein